MKRPFRAELAHVLPIDLRKTAVSSAGIIAVVGNPIFSRHWSNEVSRKNIDVAQYRPRLLRICHRSHENECHTDRQSPEHVTNSSCRSKRLCRRSNGQVRNWLLATASLSSPGCCGPLFSNLLPESPHHVRSRNAHQACLENCELCYENWCKSTRFLR